MGLDGNIYEVGLSGGNWRKITYKNLTDKFKLKQYENELEKILITKLVEDLINYFANI